MNFGQSAHVHVLRRPKFGRVLRRGRRGHEHEEESHFRLSNFLHALDCVFVLLRVYRLMKERHARAYESARAEGKMLPGRSRVSNKSETGSAPERADGSFFASILELRCCVHFCRWILARTMTIHSAFLWPPCDAQCLMRAKNWTAQSHVCTVSIHSTVISRPKASKTFLYALNHIAEAERFCLMIFNNLITSIPRRSALSVTFSRFPVRWCIGWGRAASFFRDQMRSNFLAPENGSNSPNRFESNYQLKALCFFSDISALHQIAR
jgi:hypothetical protein